MIYYYYYYICAAISSTCQLLLHTVVCVRAPAYMLRNRCWWRNVYTGTRWRAWNWTWSDWSTGWARPEPISWFLACRWSGLQTETRQRSQAAAEEVTIINRTSTISITITVAYRRTWSGRWSGVTIRPMSWTGTWWKRSTRTWTACPSASNWSTRQWWRRCAISAVKCSSTYCPLDYWRPVMIIVTRYLIAVVCISNIVIIVVTFSAGPW